MNIWVTDNYLSKSWIWSSNLYKIYHILLFILMKEPKQIKTILWKKYERTLKSFPYSDCSMRNLNVESTWILSTKEYWLHLSFEMKQYFMILITVFLPQSLALDHQWLLVVPWENFLTPYFVPIRFCRVLQLVEDLKKEQKWNYY